MRPPRITTGRAMIAVAIAALLTWWAVDQPKRRHKAMSTAAHLGGFVQLDDQYRIEPATPLAPRSGASRLLEQQFGPGYAHEVSVVSLDGSAVSDDDLADLARLTGLRRLYLNGTRVTDTGLAHLARLRDLEVLELRETAVGDAGLRALAGLPRLRVLYLDETRIGDRGMAHIGALGSLEELSLARTSVGDAGLAHLSGLTRLKILKLGRTRVTAAGLVHLAALKDMEALDVSNTGVTDAGLVSLSALPQLRVLRGDGTWVMPGRLGTRALPSGRRSRSIPSLLPDQGDRGAIRESAERSCGSTA